MRRTRGQYDGAFVASLFRVIATICEQTKPNDPPDWRESVRWKLSARLSPVGSGIDNATYVDFTRQRVVTGDGGRPRFTVRDTEEGLLVVADLNEVDRDDHKTEVNLVDKWVIVTIDDRFMWRVPVEDGWTSITDVSINNDILEARLGIWE